MQMSNGPLLNGRYELRGHVGGGGMADVYRAWDTKYNRTVAIKELRLNPQHSLAEQDTMRSAFQKEVEMLVKLTKKYQRSPHIPIFYESFEENGRSYIVMQFIEGKTLKQEMMQYPQGQLPPTLLLKYALQLCIALS